MLNLNDRLIFQIEFKTSASLAFLMETILCCSESQWKSESKRFADREELLRGLRGELA